MFYIEITLQNEHKSTSYGIGNTSRNGKGSAILKATKILCELSKVYISGH